MKFSIAKGGLSIKKLLLSAIVISCLFLQACDEQPLNSPYPHIDPKKKILFSSFSERPKTLDPVKAYSSNEYLFIQQIYEPPLTYHYLLRPYQLKPQVLSQMPQIRYLDKDYKPVSADSKAIKYSEYAFELSPGIQYQPHPAFAKNNQGKYDYYPIDENFLEKKHIEKLSDFKNVASRELVAQDFIYQIKRLADPLNHSPIASLMAKQIVGFEAFAEQLKSKRQHNNKVDLRDYQMAGVSSADKYHYKIIIHGRYPQFIYWLAMPFFAPIPWEAEQFYQQPGMNDRNINLSWYPVGTGAFMLTENNPNRRMLMEKNPNYHPAFFPSTGMPTDKAQGYLAYAGKKLPMYDAILFSLEKESIPRWNKFLQGYYDFSGISNDSFDQAISISSSGKAILTPAMQQKHISLQSTTQPSIYYMGFNMLDDVVGGQSIKAQKLRQAISIAINYEEYISIFLNGRGQIAQGPIPPGINGYQAGQAGVNPYVYQWQKDGVHRKSLAVAKKLLAEAGYPDGRSLKTGKPLILNYDTPAGSGPEEKAYFAWLRKQFAAIGLSLNIRSTQYNRFQQKMRTGKAQIFSWGWNADYPDPENFLFLFLGANGKVKFHGENAANYHNSTFDRLFIKMRAMTNGAEREAIIAKMVAILQKDAPWIWGYYPKQLSLKQTWLSKTKPISIGSGSLQYLHIDPTRRAKLQNQWNKPVLWPLWSILLAFMIVLLPVVIAYYQRTYKPRKKI